MAILQRINAAAKDKIFSLQEAFFLAWNAIRFIFARPFYREDMIQQMDAIGVQSLGIVVLTGFFTGMVLALQSAVQMARFGATTYVGSLVSASMIRELGPVLAGLMVAGRVGSGIAAQLGSMRVTEQIDALETLAYDPIAYLVVPRVLAAILMLPILVIIADSVGVGTAFATSVFATDILPSDFMQGLRLAFAPFQIVYSLIKAVVFGGAISFFCSYAGYNADAGAEGVGRSTASAVVITSVAILVLDAVIALLLAPYVQA